MSGFGLDLNAILKNKINAPFKGAPFNTSATGAEQGPPAPGSAEPKPGETRETQLPSGRRVLQTWSPTGQMTLSGDPEYAWVTEGSYFDPKDAAGGDSAANQAANRHLQAATSALSSYLQAQTLADARKQAASDTFQKMAAFAVAPGTTIMPGWEQGGPMQALAAIRGRKSFTPRALQTAHVNPADLQNPGQIPPEIAAMIDNVRGAA